jgi:hypothetical protein
MTQLFLEYTRLNVVVEWSTLLFSIREFLGSNFGPESGDSEVCRGFLQPLQVNSELVLQNVSNDRFLPNSFQLTFHSTHYSVSK